MDVDINIWAVLLAFLSSMVVGSIWYAKPLFGAEWMRLVGLTDKTAREGMARAYIPTILASLLQAFLLAYATYVVSSFYLDISWLNAALLAGSVLWLVQAVGLVTHDAFEQKNVKLTLINVGNRLATMIGMAIVIGLFEI